MASVYLSIGTVGARANNDDAMVYRGDTPITEVLTSSATSAQATMVAGRNAFVQVFCETPVMVKSGVNPTASATAGLFCPGGFITHIAVQDGHRIAVIDA